MKFAICTAALCALVGSGMAQTNSAASKSTPAEMQTRTYKGVLVDASCAMASGANRSAANSTNPAEQSAAENKTAGNAKACEATTSTSQFGLRMSDGHTYRFDMVGNQRAQEEIKNNKKWSKDASSSKEIHAKVSGVVSGEKLIVSSIK
jgi:hypothetical protein